VELVASSVVREWWLAWRTRGVQARAVVWVRSGVRGTEGRRLLWFVASSAIRVRGRGTARAIRASAAR
jgi:hypothetical protein